MAKFIGEAQPTEKTYTVELTQSECDLLGGLVNDLAEAKERDLSMYYKMDASRVYPTNLSITLATQMKPVFDATTIIADYEYDTYWISSTKLRSDSIV